MATFLEKLRNDLDQASVDALLCKKNGETENAARIYIYQVHRCTEALADDNFTIEAKQFVRRKLEMCTMELDTLTEMKEVVVQQPVAQPSMVQSAELRDVIVQPTNDISLRDLVGVYKIKRALLEVILLPEVVPNEFLPEMRYNGVLLFGPCGTGKSSLVKAVVNDCADYMVRGRQLTFFNMNLSQVCGSGHGDTERNLTELFDQARANQPAVILMDEIDALTKTRSEGEAEGTRKIKAHFLTLMDGLNAGARVIVVGTTNTPNEIDPGFLRRFERIVYVPLPTTAVRQELMEKYLSGLNYDPSIDLETLAILTFNYSHAEIKTLIKAAFHRAYFRTAADTLLHCVEAKLQWPERAPDPSRRISQEDMDVALAQTKSTNNTTAVLHIESFAHEYATDCERAHYDRPPPDYDCSKWKTHPLQKLKDDFYLCVIALLEGC